MRYLDLLLAITIYGVAGEKKCGTARWKWPEDFKLLSSKDPIWEYYNYNCWIFRDMTALQNGKYFCWKKRETLPPINFRGLWDDDHGESCSIMLEPVDFTYYTKTFCTSFPEAAKFGMTWHFNDITRYAYDKKKCLSFNSYRLLGDVWMFNYMCGENVVFEKDYCIEV